MVGGVAMVLQNSTVTQPDSVPQAFSEATNPNDRD